MASISDPSDLESILASCGVDPTISSAIVAEGWTKDLFAMCATSLADLDSHLREFQPDDHEFSFREKACIRMAWKRCQESSSSPVPSFEAPSPTAPATAGGWTETFAPKLSFTTIVALKKQFLLNYPSEVLTPGTSPSTRLLSQAYHNKKTNEIKWIPWKYRLSMAKSEDITSGRSAKVPRIESLGLHNILVDEPPAVEVSNSSMGINAVRTMFDLHNAALALVESAHLAVLRAYSIKFLSHLTQRLDQETGLRNPTILEAQSADKLIWGAISELVAEKGWSLDQAVHELTHVRSDLATLLQARPRLPRPAPPNLTLKGGGKFQPEIKGGGKKGKGGKPSKGYGKGQKWVTEMTDSERSEKAVMYEIPDQFLLLFRLQISPCMCDAVIRWNGVWATAFGVSPFSDSALTWGAHSRQDGSAYFTLA